MRYFLWVYVLVIITVVSILGFRGDTSKNPPLEVFPDMDRQLKFLEQSENNLFADRRSDRLPPVGSVVRGNALDLGNVFSSDLDIGSDVLRTGKNPDGNFSTRIPAEVEIDMALMRAVSPSTRPIFAILLPMTLPIASSEVPSRAARMATANSGAEVPNAITVAPTIKGLIFKV